ncbi:ABC transporter permease [Allorhizocola rhizosphaerae]|uniref:ABC transporter permease n=1 Tax=Allorhizocola rhizosphaerae TaxID=1872709 RepID=UPI000E3E5C7D|nr:ABC transporter permease [Allorhizocola rhizosphaerae]
MSTLWKTTVVETKLFLREPKTVLLGMLLPTAILLLLGAIPILREPSAEYGGARFVDFWAPTALVMALGMLGLQHIPAAVAAYRENGVLRRMSTTPVHPATVLVAQLIVALAAAVAAAAVLILTAWLVLDVPLPRHPLGFVAAFVAGFGALLAIGMLIAAVTPNARMANGVSILVFMLVMFAGGVYLPRFLMPEALVRMGDYAPPGVQALLETWSGDTATAAMGGAQAAGHLQPLQLGIMVLITVGAGWAAAKLFRWE